MNEGIASKYIRLALQKFGVTLFRNNVGSARTEDGRYIKFGVGGPGGGDYIGFTKYEIKPEDVGASVAVFTSIEVKSKAGRTRDAQLVFCEHIKLNGGLAAIVYTPMQAVEEVKKWRPKK